MRIPFRCNQLKLRPVVLVIGEMRCFAHNQEPITALIGDMSHIVVTGIDDFPVAKKWFPDALDVISDEEWAGGRGKRLAESWPEGAKSAQWLKLAIGIEAAERAEQAIGLKFGGLIKIRTDLVNFDSSVFDKLSVNSVMMQSDQVFWVPRNKWGVVRRFFWEIPLYTGSDSPARIKFWASMCSDVTAGRIWRMRFIRCTMARNWPWFSYVYSLAQKKFPETSERLERKVALLLTALGRWTRVDPGEVYLAGWNKDGTVAFPSEPAFLEFLLGNGIVVRNFLSSGRFGLCDLRQTRDHGQND